MIKNYLFKRGLSRFDGYVICTAGIAIGRGEYISAIVILTIGAAISVKFK